MDLALSLASLTTIALVLGAIALLRRGGYRKQAVLMLVLAAVTAINIALWAMPVPGGTTLSSAAKSGQRPE